MKFISPRYASALKEESPRIADAFVWRLKFGSAVVRTISVSPDRGPITLDVGDGDGSEVFEPFPVSADVVETRADLQVEEISLALPNVEMLITHEGGSETAALGDLVLNGILDNTELWFYRVNLKTLGVMLLSRWDIVGASEITQDEVTLQGESILGRSIRPCPHTIIQAACNNGLYDAWCAVDPAGYIASSSAITGTTFSLTSALAQADFYFDLGKITFLSGANVGASRAVGKHLNANGELTWNIPLPHVIAPGDRIEVVPGCPKTWAICDSRYSNTAKFRGFPNIPRQETM